VGEESVSGVTGGSGHGINQENPPEKGTNGTGLRAAGPFSRPRVSAERRETAGRPVHSPGIHCRDRLRAGGSRIRTLGPPTWVSSVVAPTTPTGSKGSAPAQRDRCEIAPANSPTSACSRRAIPWSQGPIGIGRVAVWDVARRVAARPCFQSSALTRAERHDMHAPMSPQYKSSVFYRRQISRIT
jgi:hypothetical protein